MLQPHAPHLPTWACRWPLGSAHSCTAVGAKSQAVSSLNERGCGPCAVLSGRWGGLGPCFYPLRFGICTILSCIFLSILLSVHLPIYLPTHPSIAHSSTHLSTHTSPIHPFIHICSSVYPSIYLLSIYFVLDTVLGPCLRPSQDLLWDTGQHKTESLPICSYPENYNGDKTCPMLCLGTGNYTALESETWV